MLWYKALEIIWNNPRSKPPARIERLGLRLQPYDFKVEFTATHAPPKAMTLAEIKAETLKDSILQEVSTHIRDNT